MSHKVVRMGSFTEHQYTIKYRCGHVGYIKTLYRLEEKPIRLKCCPGCNRRYLLGEIPIPLVGD
jgi:hypothetical protein